MWPSLTALLRALVALLVGSAFLGPTAQGGPAPAALHLYDVSASVGGRLPTDRDFQPYFLQVGGAVVESRPPAPGAPPAAGETALGEALLWAAERWPGRDLLYVGDGRSTDGLGLAGAEEVVRRGGRLFTMAPAPPPADVGLLAARRRGEAQFGELEIDLAASTFGRANIVVEPAVAPLPGREPTDPRLLRIEREIEFEPGFHDRLRLVLPPGPTMAGPLRVRLVPAPGTPNDDLGNDRLVVSAAGIEARVRVWGDLPREGLASLPDALVGPVPRELDDMPLQGGLLVMSNVPAGEVQPHLAALARHVARGGSLLVLGGPDAWGAGGYGGSPFEERLLPLRVRREDGLARAAVVLLDRSGSMSGAPLAHARDAAREAVRSLAADETIAVLPFAARPDEALLGPGFVRTDAREALERALADVAAYGDTDWGLAIEDACRRLEGIEAKERLVVLVSDGDPDHRPEPESLLRARAALAAAGARLIAFVSRMEAGARALGELAAPADVMLLRDASQLRVALLERFARDRREGERLVGPWLPRASEVEGAALATLLAALGPLPLVHDLEMNATSQGVGNGIVVALATRAGAIEPRTAPLLAKRVRGAGQVYAMAWGPEWLPAGRERLAATQAIAPLLQGLAAQSAPEVAADFLDGQLIVLAPELAGLGRLDVVPAVAEGVATPVASLLEVRAGRFEGAFDEVQPVDGLLLALEARGKRDRPLRLPARPPPESRGVGVDFAQLEALAEAGGGRRIAAVGELPRDRNGHGASLVPWILLLAVALLVWERTLVAAARREVAGRQ